MKKKSRKPRNPYDEDNNLFRSALLPNMTRRTIDTMKLMNIKNRTVAVELGLKLFNDTYNPE
jgi:hypothetical protein